MSDLDLARPGSKARRLDSNAVLPLHETGQRDRSNALLLAVQVHLGAWWRRRDQNARAVLTKERVLVNGHLGRPLFLDQALVQEHNVA